MADGRGRGQQTIICAGDHDGSTFEALPLRVKDDAPDDRALVLQLHGSLGWLRRRDQAGVGRHSVWRFNIDDLRKIGYCKIGYQKKWREGSSPWEPVVVLTDQKSNVIERWPFSFAYEVFATRLERADRLLIAGYGFGDKPVNAAIRRLLQEHETRKRLLQEGRTRGQSPRILVVDYAPEGEQADEKRKELIANVESELGISEDEFTLSLDGIPGVINTKTWRDWASE